MFEDANDLMILSYVCVADKVFDEMVTGYELTWSIVGVYWRQAVTSVVYGSLGKLGKKKERKKKKGRIKKN